GRPAAALVTLWLLPMVTLLAAGTLVRELVTRLRHTAGHDPLTGLPNRARFGEDLDRMLADGEPVAVLFIDLDDFKRVTDSLGHAVGDSLLVAVAERLRGSAHASTVIARFGGDEFVAATRSREWERLQESFAEPFAIGDYELSVRASLGIAVAHPGE